MKKIFSKFGRPAGIGLLLALFLGIAVHLGPAWAQETTADPGPDLSDLSLEELLVVEIDTVYAASSFQQRVTEAPSAVSVITADEIRKYGYRSFADILDSLRGVFITNDRNYDYVNVRGFGLPSDYNNRVLLLVDGIRMNDNIYDSAGIGYGFAVDVDLIERVEFVRGPSSSLYGTSAFFGVISVTTRTGEAINGAEVSGAYGTFDTKKARLTYGRLLDNGIVFRFSWSEYGSKGDEEYYIREYDAPETNYGVAKGRDGQRYSLLSAGLSWKDFQLTGLYYYMRKEVPTAAWEGLFNKDMWTVDNGYHLDLKYEKTYASDLYVMTRINYNGYQYWGDYDYQGTPAWGEDPIVTNDDTAEGRWLFGELQVRKILFEDHSITVGASFQENIQQDQATEYAGADPEEWGVLDSTERSSSWSAYLQDEYAVLEQLRFNAGLRYDWYESFGGITNPRLALIFSPLEQSSFKALYGTAFRSPNAYELYFEDGVTQKVPADLDPETIETYELIYEQYYGKGNQFRTTLGGYIYRVKDLIIQTTDPTDDLIVFANVDEVEASGFEAEAAGKTSGGVEGRVSYLYQENKNKGTKRRLTNSPRHVAKGNLIVPLLPEKLFLGLEEQYISERKTLAGDRTHEVLLTNLTLYGQELLPGFEVSLTVYNLLDATYKDPGASEHALSGIDRIPQDGRAFQGKITYHF